MKIKSTMFFLMPVLFLFNSCIKDEALNSEADITSCKVDNRILIRDPVITNESVKLYVKDSVDIKSQSPQFTLTDGATISPASGTTLDFSKPQTYIVKSQDGNWQKPYTVEFTFSNMQTQYDFENIRYGNLSDDGTGNATTGFDIFYDTNTEGEKNDWGSGNEGFAILNSDKPANQYPTFQDDNGYIGKCVNMTTRSTGQWGAWFGTPIAAGNLFLGTFNLDLSSPAKSTHFGIPFKHTPTELVGYYKYKAGPIFTDAKNNPVQGKTDTFDIYAVLYEVTKDVQYLDGTNSLTSSNIVAIARITDKKETDTWTRFAIPFAIRDGKSIDADKLQNGNYNISIIMSSSEDGAAFNGAVGSSLCVDEMQLFYK